MNKMTVRKVRISYDGYIPSGDDRNKISFRGRKVYNTKEYALFKKQMPWVLKHHGGVEKFMCKEKLKVSFKIYSNLDIDNAQKTIFDSLQKIVYGNDNQIMRLDKCEIIRNSGMDGFVMDISEIPES